jgi:sulfate-transporting ATPase
MLEALAEWVVDVEYGELKIYEGNYSSYLDQKQTTLNSQKATHLSLQKALARELDFVRSNRRGGGGAAREKR